VCLQRDGEQKAARSFGRRWRGFPNGRRLTDDVVDIAARAVAGVLAGPQYNYPIGDGVNAPDVAPQETFPYVAWAYSGRNSHHVDPATQSVAVWVELHPARSTSKRQQAVGRLLPTETQHSARSHASRGVTPTPNVAGA